MKKILITTFILASFITSAQDQTQDLIFDNNTFIYFKDATGANDGVRLGRHTGNSMRLRYGIGGLIFDALDNQAVQFRNSANELKVLIHPAGDSYFTGGKVGFNHTSPSAEVDILTPNLSWGLIVRGQTSTLSGIKNVNSNIELHLRRSDDTIGTYITSNGKSYFTGGKVGFNHTNPSAEVDILAPNHAWGLIVRGQSSSLSGIKNVNSSMELHLRKGDDTIGTFITSNGNSYFNGGKIGVGKTTPQYDIDVAGSVNALDLLINGQSISSTSIWQSNSGNINFSSGNVGIGTNNPSSSLQVGNETSNDEAILRIGASGNANKKLQFYRAGNVDAEIFEDANENFNIINHFAGKSIVFGTEGVEKMRINSRGQVGIGTASTGMGTHKLAVEGTIGAREIKVEATGWSDFVFYNDYNLPSLEEVEKYITENNHLPEIPSEAEVLEDGINLGEMNAKLLQKIEELTLYLIDQNKEIKSMRSELDELKSGK